MLGTNGSFKRTMTLSILPNWLQSQCFRVIMTKPCSTTNRVFVVRKVYKSVLTKGMAQWFFFSSFCFLNISALNICEICSGLGKHHWSGKTSFFLSEGRLRVSWQRKDFFSVAPLHLMGITYQQANQLSHWPHALWHSLVQHVTVMEGWACPGIHYSRREYMVHN